MQVTLTKELEKLVKEKVRSGRYADASDVMRDALRGLELRDEYERWNEPFEITVMAEVATLDELARFGEAGVTRVIVAPWQRTRDAGDGLRRLAERVN